MDASVESERSGVEVHVDALAAYGRQSTTAGAGTDIFATVAKRTGPDGFETYRYAGNRNVPGGLDRFWRQGFSLGYAAKNLSLTGVMQTGNDSVGNGSRASTAHSSGGFLEGTYDPSPALRFAGRYERVPDVFSGASEQLVFAAIARPGHNMRFIVEELIAGGRHTVSSALLFAY